MVASSQSQLLVFHFSMFQRCFIVISEWTLCRVTSEFNKFYVSGEQTVSNAKKVFDIKLKFLRGYNHILRRLESMVTRLMSIQYPSHRQKANWANVPRDFLTMFKTLYPIGHEWSFCHSVIHIQYCTYIIQLTALGVFSGRLHQVTKLPIFTVFLIMFLTINHYPPCQLSMWEETGEPRENPRLSGKCEELRCSIRGSNGHGLSGGRKSIILRRLI